VTDLFNINRAIKTKNTPLTNPDNTCTLPYPYENNELDSHVAMTAAYNPVQGYDYYGDEGEMLAYNERCAVKQHVKSV
jgi:hypothetical protein